MKLLITDLDNTLYDWVSYFARSFSAMLDALSPLLEVDKEQLCQEFKAIHQHHGDSELPFACLELPSVARRFPGRSPSELLRELNDPLHAFNSARKQHLKLYPAVADTLAELQNEGVLIVGHTEASVINAYYRIRKLDIEQHFHHLYAIDGSASRHPEPSRREALKPPPGFVSLIPPTERKPNPALLLDICAREGIPVNEAVYVGDSITRDMSMAKQAGVVAAWARYGTHYERHWWDILVKITHWTNEDVAREAALRHLYSMVNPDYFLDSFAGLMGIFHNFKNSFHRAVG